MFDILKNIVKLKVTQGHESKKKKNKRNRRIIDKKHVTDTQKSVDSYREYVATVSAREKVTVMTNGLFQGRGSSFIHLLVIVDVFGHLPHLHNVVLGDGANDPWFVGIPRKVADLGSVSAMNEEKLWWTVLRILRTLFLANLAEVPDMEPSIGARGGEDGLVMRRPLHLENLVLVRFEGVKLQLQVPQIP